MQQLAFLSSIPLIPKLATSKQFTTSPFRKTITCSRERLPDNVPGNIFVDSSCINCDTCRWMTPAVFHSANNQSAVHTQPTEDQPDLLLSALQAAVACPTGSIRTEKPHPLAREAAMSFPLATPLDNVYFNGYTAPETFAASSWLVQTEHGAIVFDCPRYSSKLANRFKEMDVKFLVLSHRDDVAGHEKWTDKLNITRVIHVDEANANQGTDQCEVQLDTHQFPYQLVPGVTIHHIPGHTQGSIGMLHEASETFFSGDHLAASQHGELTAFERYCSYSWKVQRESMEKLAQLQFKNILPGHGRPAYYGSVQEMRESVGMLVDKMRGITARQM